VSHVLIADGGMLALARVAFRYAVTMGQSPSRASCGRRSGIGVHSAPDSGCGFFNNGRDAVKRKMDETPAHTKRIQGYDDDRRVQSII